MSIKNIAAQQKSFFTDYENRNRLARENTPYLTIIKIIALLYGTILASLPLNSFKDRENYINYVIESTTLAEQNLSSGLLSMLTNEPIWLLINIIADQIATPEQAIRFYIFSSATIFSYLFLRKDPEKILWLFIFLFSPQIIKNYIIHLRQGVAISVFFLGLSFSEKNRRLITIGLTPFIHSSFFFVLFFFGLNKLLEKIHLSYGPKIYVFFMASLASALYIGYITSTLGARQATEGHLTAQSFSGLGFSFWIFIFFIFLMQGKKFISQNIVAVFSLLFYLTSYFFIEISGRIFESTLFMILLAGLSMKTKNRIFFSLSMCFYIALSYSMKIKEPWLGFGF